jgi:tRNA pseudouridine65 synthase
VEAFMISPDAVRILYRDAWLIAVDKPSGMIVHRGWANDPEPLLQTVRDRVGRHVFPLHRLDRGTSGIVLFALDSATAGAVGEAFAEGHVTKHYLALVRGRPAAAVTVDHPLKDDAGNAREARTEVRLLASSPIERCSLVEAEPHTGRPHQIRRHLKHLSHPIVGDVRYGKGDVNRHYREHFGLHRLALHAHRVVLPAGVLPGSSAPLEVVAPLPEDLREPLQRLGLHATG